MTHSEVIERRLVLVPACKSRVPNYLDRDDYHGETRYRERTRSRPDVPSPAGTEGAAVVLDHYRAGATALGLLSRLRIQFATWPCDILSAVLGTIQLRSGE